MAIHVVWDNEERTVIRYEFEQTWTWDEFFVAKRQADALRDEVPHRVAAIFNAPPDVVLPPNLLANSRRALSQQHPRGHMVVVVLTSPTARMLLGALVKISGSAGTRMEIVDTLQEARALIARQPINA